MSAGRLDEAKIETLRGWGEGLQIDPREELRAAGRAITILVEEIERLNIDLWHERASSASAAREQGNAILAARPSVGAPSAVPAY